MAYDGAQNTTRVTHFGESKLHAYVIDNVLNSTTLWSRLQSMGQDFSGPTMKYTIKITDSGLGEFYQGLETFSSSATEDTIQLEYAHTGFEQPIVDIMLETMANNGSNDEIPLPKYKMNAAAAEATQKLGLAVYGSGTGKAFNGLGNLVAATGTIGGQSRSTYSQLASTVTASGGTISLAKMATLHDAVSDTGVDEQPTTFVTTFDVWSLYEQLLTPSVRADYSVLGYSKLPVNGKSAIKAGEARSRAAAGFDTLFFRGTPIIKDKACTSGYFYALNENYLFWLGRKEVPANYKPFLKYVSLGKAQTMEGQSAMPSENHGFFFQDFQMMPNQAGMVGRYHVIGQMVVTQPRRQGVLTGITGV